MPQNDCHTALIILRHVSGRKTCGRSPQKNVLDFGAQFLWAFFVNLLSKNKKRGRMEGSMRDSGGQSG